MRKIAVFVSVCVVLFFLLSFGGRAIADGCGTTEPPVQPPNEPPYDPTEPPAGMPGSSGCGVMPSPYMGDMWGGKFDYADGHANGMYIDFAVNETTGEISDFTVKTTIVEWPGWNYSDIIVNGTGSREPGNGTTPPPPNEPKPEPPTDPINPPEPTITYKNITVFKSITVERFAPFQAPTIVGGMFLFISEEMLIMVYDSPFANLFYAATSGATGNNTVVFTVAEGFNITTQDDWLIGVRNGMEPGGNSTDPVPPTPPEFLWKEVWLSSENLSGSIFGENADVGVDGSTVTFVLEKGGYLRFNAYAIIPMFMTMLGPDVGGEEMNDMKNAVAEGKVGAEITIGSGGNAAAQPPSGGAPPYDTVRYDTSLELRPVSYNSDKIEVEVASAKAAGRVVIVNVDKDVMSIGSQKDVTVKLDGSDIAIASSAADVLSASGTSAKAYMVLGSGGTTLVVYVPHFSTHTLTIEKITLGSIQTVLVPVLAAVAVVGAAFAFLTYRRKKSD